MLASVIPLKPKINEDSAEDANEEAEEWEGGDNGSPSSVFLVDNGKDFKCGVEDGVDEGGVDGYTCYHRLRDEHANRSSQLFGDNGVEVDFDVLVRMMISFIAGFLSEADGFLFEEEGAIYFG